MPPESLRTVFIPGLLCSARLYDPLLSTAWAYGAVTLADNRRDDTIPSMAARLLDDAPQRFVLVGLSMGGYVALEVLRQAPERVSGLALISTSARPDSAEQLQSRERQRQAVVGGGFDELVAAVFPLLPDPANAAAEHLLAGWRLMAHEGGAAAFVAQLDAVRMRPDSRPGLAAITWQTAGAPAGGNGTAPGGGRDARRRGAPSRRRGRGPCRARCRSR